jgi:hypothetical protein
VLLALLPLLNSFTINHWFIIVDVENYVSSSWWEDRKAWKT